MTVCKSSGNGEWPALLIDGPANCYAFVEYPLRTDSNSILGAQVDVLCGHDAGNAWGAGIALCWSAGRFVRVNVRADGRYGIDDGQRTSMTGMTPDKGWTSLRIRLTSEDVVAEASADLRLWAVLGAFPRELYPGDPVAVRVGKMSRWGTPQDFHRPGPYGSAALRHLALHYANRCLPAAQHETTPPGQSPLPALRGESKATPPPQ